MNRGTRVAKAMVDLSVDGDGINEEIVDSVAKAGPGVEKEGEEHGEKYGGRFGEGFRSRLEKITPRISKALGERLSVSGNSVGESFADRMVNKFMSSGVGEKIADRLRDDILPDAENVGEEAGDRLGSSLVASLQARLAKADKDSQRALSRLLDADPKKDKNYAGFIASARIAEAAAARLERQLRSLMIAEGLIGSAGGRGGKGGGFDIGRLFGAGSRNNGLNLIGKTIGGTVKLTQKLTAGFSSMFGTFMKGTSQAAQGASMFQKGMSGMSAVSARLGGSIAKVLPAIAAAAPAAVVGIVAVIGVLSVLASVVGALVGIVTALAATITSALVGALAVAGGAILAVVAAGGLLTAAFMSMTNAQRDALKDAFVPLREVMTGIGQIMITEMVPAFATWSANLQRAAALAAPAAQVMGQAFAEAGNKLTASFSGPGFQAFAQAMTIYLPSIVTRMSAALGGFLNGMMGMFSALMPLVNQFAGWLERIGVDFSAWANSATGQNAIVDFANRAVESLQSLWGFVSEFFGFLGDLMFSAEAQSAGNSMFDSLREAFERFRAAISSGDLERWFDDAADLGGALWEVMQSLWDVFMALYSSGTIDGVAAALAWTADAVSALASVLGPAIDAVAWLSDKFHGLNDSMGGIPGMIAGLLHPLSALIGQFERVGQMIQMIKDLAGGGDSGGISGYSLGGDISGAVNRAVGGAQKQIKKRTVLTGGNGFHWNVPKLRDSGADARSKTYKKYGGTMPDPEKNKATTPARYENPYKDWAASLVKMGPALRKEMADAVKALRKEALAGIRDAAKSTDYASMNKDFSGVINDMRKGGKDMVDDAQRAVESAARRLGSANSAKEAKAALKEVRKAQADLKWAIKNARKLDRASQIMEKQAVANVARTRKLLAGQKVANATLGDYALARQSLAVTIEKANEKLVEAVALRDDYAKAVTDSAKAFAALTGAQAKTINGVEQALTATDINTHLEDRLDKIRNFQSNLQLLLAQGLSDAAYKQIVDAGVDGGSAYADALVAGGIGAIGTTNNLVAQIDAAAGQLGSATSTRLYQAGVDAAQGLLDGLTKKDAELERAAFLLGEKIAKQVKRALGIKSPSTVMISAMDDLGDGAVIGLDKQHGKVQAAADDFAKHLLPSPQAALDDARLRAAADGQVSGNQRSGGDRNITVITPTKDPVAVAHEVMNELTGTL